MLDEREAEAEFLAQRNSRLLIKGGKYDPKKNLLVLEGKIEQLALIDYSVNDVKIKLGV